MSNYAVNIARYQEKCRKTEIEKAAALKAFFKKRGLSYLRAVPLVNEIRAYEGLAPIAIGTIANWCSSRAKIPDYIIRYIQEN